MKLAMKLVILDRDGVINYDSDEFIKSPDEWIPIPGSLAAIAELNKQGFTVAIATNQSGIGRGYYSLETLNAIHQKMLQAIKDHGGEVAALAFCPHNPDDNCECRKPKAGMLHQIAMELNADLSKALVIGDSLRDIQAGLLVQAQAALVLTGKGEKTLSQNPEAFASVPVYKDLAALVANINAFNL
jgi:D-glycero-D-manno-heptose 1,7-bisphosphate phosphatase